eukprot:6107536-Prymnesium_polylepis.1
MAQAGEVVVQENQELSDMHNPGRQLAHETGGAKPAVPWPDPMGSLNNQCHMSTVIRSVKTVGMDYMGIINWIWYVLCVLSQRRKGTVYMESFNSLQLNGLLIIYPQWCDFATSHVPFLWSGNPIPATPFCFTYTDLRFSYDSTFSIATFWSAYLAGWFNLTDVYVTLTDDYSQLNETEGGPASVFFYRLYGVIDFFLLLYTIKALVGNPKGDPISNFIVFQQGFAGAILRIFKCWVIAPQFGGNLVLDVTLFIMFNDAFCFISTVSAIWGAAVWIKLILNLKLPKP